MPESRCPIHHALLLSAGLGTRLRPLTSVRAKAAIPVAGEPLVRRIVRWLAASGVDELVLNLHHLPQTIARVMGDGSDLGVRVRYSWEQPEVLGSAGGPRLALPIVGASPFFIVNGDTLTDVDLSALATAHIASAPPEGDTVVTLALIPNHEPLRYGGILLDADSRVVGFTRRGAAAAGSFHFVGVQAVNAEAFAWLPERQAFNSIGYAYDRLIAEYPGSIRGFVTDAMFHDIGTVADYIATCRSMGALGMTPGATVRVAPTAHVEDCILWDNIDIDDGCRLDGCIVTDGVRLRAGSTYERAILIQGPDGTTAVPLDDVYGA